MRGPIDDIIGRHFSSAAAGAGGGGGGGDDAATGVIRHDRKCRDLPFLALFAAFSVAMIVNSSFGFNQGNPLRLTYGLDYKGNICGSKHADPDLSELDVRYWMNPNQVYQSGLKDSKIDLADAKSICLMECPYPAEDGLNFVCDYPEGDIRLSVDDWIDRDYDYFEYLTPEMRNTSLQLQGPCYPIIFPSINVYWSCQFIARPSNVSLKHWQRMGGASIDENMLIDKTIHNTINYKSSVLKRYVADIGKSWPVLIACGGLLPQFLAVIWLAMIRYFVAGMPWITVILFNALVISVTMFFYIKAGWIGNDPLTVVIGPSDPYVSISGREITHLHVAAVLMTIVMIIALLTSIAIVRRILKATSVLKVAAKVIGEVQELIIVPVVPYLALAIIYMFWFAATLYLFSSGQVLQNDCKANCCTFDLKEGKVNCDNCCGYSVHYTPHIGIAIFFHLFGCYWATQFFIACSSTVIAGSVASYYWARGETSHNDVMQHDITFHTVVSSLKRLLRYSLGSVALGSLIVSTVEWVQSILKSLRRRLKTVDSAGGSSFQKTVSSSSNCCLGCIDWTIKSVNRNAYIVIATTGKGFCKASELATGLIMNNILRIGQVNVIGDVILFLGKLCVSLFSALFAFLMLDNHKYRSAHNKISSPLFPVLLCWALGYVVAQLFFGVVEVGVETIIMSFCQDAEEHDGEAQYAPRLLMETLGDPSQLQRLTQGP
ncbi:choline transporter protein 1-like [Lolium rigidum]|uniref:choline transporter protein 1-like n=1 Tax=Lolium rigidum TaxID=89674 RepID=UPI001F5C5665|nr:choline transporter protein 1-like [Lolium rigidum]